MPASEPVTHARHSARSLAPFVRMSVPGAFANGIKGLPPATHVCLGCQSDVLRFTFFVRSVELLPSYQF